MNVFLTLSNNFDSWRLKWNTGCAEKKKYICVFSWKLSQDVFLWVEIFLSLILIYVTCGYRFIQPSCILWKQNHLGNFNMLFTAGLCGMLAVLWNEQCATSNVWAWDYLSKLCQFLFFPSPSSLLLSNSNTKSISVFNFLSICIIISVLCSVFWDWYSQALWGCLKYFWFVSFSLLMLYSLNIL